MDEAEPVDVADGEDELAKDALALGLLEVALLDEVVVQLAAGAELRHEPDARLGRDDLVQPHDVVVVQPPMVVDLAREQRRRQRARDLLDGASRARQAVHGQSDLAERACSESAPFAFVGSTRPRR